MIMNFRGWVLDWYMKFSIVPTSTPQKTLVEIKVGLTDEFMKPKSKSQCITKMKYIK